MPQVFFKDGRPVPDAQVAEAVAKGEAFAKSQRVAVRDQNGQIGTIDASELGHPGYRLLNDQEIDEDRMNRERGTLGQQAITFAEGAGRGLTLGASDVVATGLLGDDYRQAALERTKVNPLAAIGGEIAGAVGGSFLGGEGALGLLGAPTRAVGAVGRTAEGLAGRGLEALGYEGSSALGRLSARSLELGVSGAAEGAMYGAGQALSKSALDGSDLSAEKVLASMGQGAVLGGVSGGALGALSEGGSLALEKAGGLRASAETLANESALKAVGFQGSDFRKLVGRRTGEAAEGKLDELGQELLNYEFKTGPRAGQKLFRSAVKAEDLVDDVVYARQETGEVLGALKAKIDAAAMSNPALAPKVEEYLAKVDSEVIQPLRDSLSPSVRARAAKVEDELGLLRERQAERTAALSAEPQRVRLPDGSIEMRPRAVPPEATFAELDEFRQHLRSVFQPPRPASGGIPAAVPEHAASLERAERLLADHLDESAEKALTSMGEEPEQYAALKKQYSNLKDVEQVAQKADLQQMGNRAISPSDYASGVGAGLGALMTGNVGALGYGVAATVAHKLIRERGRSTLAVLAQRVAELDSGIDHAAQALVGSVPRRALTRAAVIAGELSDQYQHAAQAVQAFRDNPSVAGDRMAHPVTHFVGDYPTLASGVQGQIAQANAFLASKLPSSTSRAGSTLTPQLTKPRTSPPDMAKFLRYVRGASRPQDVIDDLAAGKIDREGIEAMKAVFPSTFSELRTRVMTYASGKGKELSFNQRILLSLAFDFPGDKSVDPAYLNDIQTAFQPAGAQPEGRPSGGMKVNPKAPSDMLTPSQSVGAGG